MNFEVEPLKTSGWSGRNNGVGTIAVSIDKKTNSLIMVERVDHEEYRFIPSGEKLDSKEYDKLFGYGAFRLINTDKALEFHDYLTRSLKLSNIMNYLYWRNAAFTSEVTDNLLAAFEGILDEKDLAHFSGMSNVYGGKRIDTVMNRSPIVEYDK